MTVNYCDLSFGFRFTLESVTLRFQLYRPSRQGGRQQRKGRSCCGGSVSVDSGDGTPLSCGPAGLSPCSRAVRKGRDVFRHREERVPNRTG